MTIPWLKIASIAIPIASAGIAIISGKVEEQKLDAKVAEKVAEAISKKSE